MKKTLSFPFILIMFTFAYSLTHLKEINQITATTFQDVLQLFYAIFFWIFLFQMAKTFHIFDWIGQLLSPILHPIFKLTPQQCAIFITSIFAGFPTYAKIIKDSSLTKTQQQHLLKCCSYPSIGFVLSLFPNKNIGYLLFFIQIMTNFIIAFCCRKEQGVEINENEHTKHPSFMYLMKQHFKTTFELFIYIFGFMLVFRILRSMIAYDSIILDGLFEFSQGCIKLKNYPIKQAFILSSFFLSFSSLSVIFQVSSIMEDVITLQTFILFRLRQALISSFIAYVFTLFLL